MHMPTVGFLTLLMELYAREIQNLISIIHLYLLACKQKHSTENFKYNCFWLLEIQWKNCCTYPTDYGKRKLQVRARTCVLWWKVYQLIPKSINMTYTAYCCPFRRLPHTHWCAQKDSFYPSSPDPNFISLVATCRSSHSTVAHWYFVSLVWTCRH